MHPTNQTYRKTQQQQKKNATVIDLVHQSEQQQKPISSSKKNMILPTLIILIAMFILAIAFMDETETVSEDGKINLLSPSKQQKSLPIEEIKKTFALSIRGYESDTFEAYMDAQNKLVKLVEASPQNTEIRSMLCLVYKELWPFAKQDSTDIKTISFVTQSTRALDPIGIDGQICEAVKMLTLGRYKEARSIIENTLMNDKYAASPILFGLKGELFFEDRDYQSATAYLDKAIQLWPQWIKPKMLQAEVYKKTKNPSEAYKIYAQVLSKSKAHKNATLQMGVLEYNGFRKVDQAFSRILSGLKMKGRLIEKNEAQVYQTLAEIYVEKQDKKNALAAAQKALTLNPTNQQVKDLVVRLGGSDKSDLKSAQSTMLYLGEQYLRTGDCLAAQAEFKAAFEVDPKNATAAMKAAKCLWQLNQATEALEYLSKAIRVDSKLISAYALQADYYSQRYNYVSAIQTLNRASKITQNNYEILRSYALVELRRNNAAGAVAYGQKALKAYDSDVDTLILLSKAYSLQGEHKEAFKFAVRATELDSTNSEAQIVYAKVLSQFQGIEAGINYIKELINKYTYTHDYRIALAEMLQAEERYSQSAEIFEQVTVIDPKNKKAFLGLGESYQAIANFSGALKAYLTAAVLDPTDAEPLFKAGTVYLETDRYREAITQFERAIKINNLYPRLYYSIGRAAFLAGDLDGAINAASQEKKMNPNLADAYLLSAEIYTTRSQFQKCAAEYQQAIKLRPQGADIYVRLARCYRQSANLDIAEAMVNVAASKESGMPEIYREQGAIYEQRGDLRSAAQAYAKYLALSPNAPDKNEIEIRINNLGK